MRHVVPASMVLDYPGGGPPMIREKTVFVLKLFYLLPCRGGWFVVAKIGRGLSRWGDRLRRPMIDSEIWWGQPTKNWVCWPFFRAADELECFGLGRPNVREDWAIPGAIIVPGLRAGHGGGAEGDTGPGRCPTPRVFKP